MAPSRKTRPVRDFAHFLPEVSDQLRTISDTYLEAYDEHQAFDYLVAELFETTHDDSFAFTDGPNDGGIDFLVRDEQAYTIAQCKCPDLDRLGDNTTPPTFDQEALDQLNRAILMLRDRKGEYDVTREIKQLRGDYQRDLTADPDSTQLTAILAILGSLTGPARTAFESRKAELGRANVRLKLVEWTDVYDALHALASPADVDFNIKINFGSSKNILPHSNYCYVLAHAYDFYEAFRKHQWNLFEWNVRFQIPNSPINRRIVNALSRAKGRKQFHHYNNGLLITCRHYKIDETRGYLTLRGPQVINGCQTVRAICEAYDSLTPEHKGHLEANTYVQVKVIKTTDPAFIGELVISTNDQNAMNPRNLKSNRAEQREIQEMFRAMPKRWFYQRKDGEFKSLKEVGGAVRWFRKSDYAVGRKRDRLVDNQDLAKAWYAYTGHSHAALMGGLDYFGEKKQEVYERVFKSIPSPAFWSAFAKPVFLPDAALFAPGTPSPYQYLLSYGIARYVRTRQMSHKANRSEAICRAIRRGVLPGNADTGQCTASREQEDEFLAGDDEYFINKMLIQIREVFVELVAFVLVLKYGPCDAQTSQKLVTNFADERRYFESGFDAEELGESQTGETLFGPIYEFLRYCVSQYYYRFQAEIKAAPRLKSYFANRKTVNRLRDEVLNRNTTIAGYDAPWKKADQAFLQSMPDL